MPTQIELAHYGGWKTEELLSGVAAWGDPLIRNFEVYASNAGISVELPDETSPRFQAGVPYYVLSTKPSTSTVYDVNVVDGSGSVIGVLPAPTLTLEASYAEFVWAGQWLQVENGVGALLDEASFPGSGGPISSETYSFTVFGNIPNLNIYDRAVAAGYTAGEHNAHIQVVIAPGSIIGSAHDDQPAITTGTGWGNACTCTIDVQDSYVIGWGGKGGDGSPRPVGGISANAGDGQPGTAAIHSYIDTHIINVRSYISGGGGGGGGGGAYDSDPVTSGLQGNGGSGGGGPRGGNMDSTGTLQQVFGGANGGSDPGVSGYATNGPSGTHLQPGINYGSQPNVHPGGDGGNHGGSGTGGSWSSASAQGGAGGDGGSLIRTPNGGGINVTATYIDPVTSNYVDPITGDVVTLTNTNVVQPGFGINGSVTPAFSPSYIDDDL